MAEEHHELVIIRHRADHEEGHHGGAWKIAFADFMTAMMALFLVLWLINSTSPKVKTTIARYFNPVKLVEMTPVKKGFNDPTEGESFSGAEGRGTVPTDDTQKHPDGTPVDPGGGSEGAGKATHSEAALFRDPYAVLSEIATADDVKAKAAAKSQAHDAAPQDVPEPFRDPFATMPDTSLPEPQAPGLGRRGLSQTKAARLPDAVAGKADAATPPEGQAAAGLDLKAALAVESRAVTATGVKGAAKPTEAEAASQLQGDLAQAISKANGGKLFPNVEVKGSDEGLLISLTDEQAYAMFAVGSAEPDAKTIRAMEIVARQLKTRDGKIIIRGFTDGRPYKSANYDNWRLSSARAHMAQYMLIRGGLDESRIGAIEGFADRRPKVPKDPLAAENRRIEILLKSDTPR